MKVEEIDHRHRQYGDVRTAKPFPRKNATIVHQRGKFASFHCSCGRSPKTSRRTKQFDKKNCDASSIPGHVIKQNLTHGAKHGASERQQMYNKVKDMLQKARHNMVVTKSFWKDGTRMTISASVCQILSGLRSRLFSVMNLHWKTTHILQQQKERTRNEKNRFGTLVE